MRFQTLAALTAGCLALAGPSSTAAKRTEDSKVQMLRDLSAVFQDVARKAKNSVVYLDVERVSRRAGYSRIRSRLYICVNNAQ